MIVIEGKGNVAIESCASTKLIHDVLYVDEIDQNLVSVGQVVEKGFEVIFNDKGIFSIKMRGSSLSFDPMNGEKISYPATIDSAKIWHKRLGHFHHAVVPEFVTKGIGLWLTSYGF